MLKTHANPADKDSLFSYVTTDPLLRRMTTDEPQSQEDVDAEHQRQVAQVKKSDEFKQLKQKIRIGGVRPSDEKIVDMILRRREVVKARQQREAQQQVQSQDEE